MFKTFSWQPTTQNTPGPSQKAKHLALKYSRGAACHGLRMQKKQWIGNNPSMECSLTLSHAKSKVYIKIYLRIKIDCFAWKRLQRTFDSLSCCFRNSAPTSLSSEKRRCSMWLRVEAAVFARCYLHWPKLIPRSLIPVMTQISPFFGDDIFF